MNIYAQKTEKGKPAENLVRTDVYACTQYPFVLATRIRFEKSVRALGRYIFSIKATVTSKLAFCLAEVTSLSRAWHMRHVQCLWRNVENQTEGRKLYAVIPY